MSRLLNRSMGIALILAIALNFVMPSIALAVKNTYAEPEKLDAIFTPNEIVLDGLPDAAYSSAPVGVIDNAKTAAGNVDYTAGPAATGEIRAVWNGPVLYVLVKVNDSTISRNSSTVNNRDGVEFSLDVWNDKIDKWEDDDGLFTVSSLGAITGNTGNQTGSVHFDTTSREFTNRIKGAAASDIIDPDTNAVVGYYVELALQIENVFHAAGSLQNGRKIGLDAQINDSFVESEARTARVFWSHYDNNYDRISTQDGNLDWGEITLTGKTEADSFVFDDWRLKELIRFVNNPKFRTGPGMYTPATETTFNEKFAAAQALVDSGSTDKAAVDLAAEELSQAILGLRRAGKYPDPYDLPSLFTLPDPWTFFDSTKGTSGKVTTVAEWRERRDEILDLAQYYEYGYVQDGVVSLRSVTTTDTTVTINYTVSANDKELNLSSTITLPTVATAEPAPIILGGSGSVYTGAGIATATVPNTATDDRLNGINTRSGGYWDLFPYNRNNPTEPGVEIAAAWGFWRTIDALELVAERNPDVGAKGKFNDLLNIEKLASYGFSINGKISFVAGVFDERIGVVIAGAAGCTGPSPYRYNNFGPGPWNLDDYIGQHLYNWGNTDGNEVLGDTLTHQPQRVNEMMLRFSEPLNLYKRVEGSYGYGDRMPFDQHLLVAAIAPRAIVVDHTLDDYGDSAEGDATGLEAAKPVYEWLGAGIDKLAFNYRASGGHGVDDAVLGRNAEFINYYFNNAAMTPETASLLATNPYVADIMEGMNVYERYFGGLNAMMPWRLSPPAVLPEIVIHKQPAANTNLFINYAEAPTLSVEAESRGGAGDLTYQWYSNTTSANTGGTLVEGATAATFQVPTGLGEGTYYYYVVVNSSNHAEPRSSEVAQITVRVPSTDSSLKSVAINVKSGPWWAPVTTAYPGTPHETEPNAYNIVIPYMPNLDTLEVTAFDAAANDPGATVGTPVKFDAGARWTITITAEDGTTATTYTVYVSAPHIPVTNITGVPAKVGMGTDLKLKEAFFGVTSFNLGKVQPANASFAEITWSLSDTTNASLVTSGGGWTPTVTVLHFASDAPEGTQVTLTSTITDGAAPGTSYIQEFIITLVNPVPVTDITGIPDRHVVSMPLELVGTVVPANATNQDILWEVKADGTTAPGAEITDGNMLSVTGPGAVIVTATIIDGAALTGMTPGTNFVKDFTIYYPSPVNTLQSLTTSAGVPTPAFDPDTTAYSLNLPYATNTITVTPVLTDVNATVTVNGEVVANGEASQEISLNAGQTEIVIVVTAEDETTKTYTLTITRPYVYLMPVIGKFGN